MNKTIHFQDLFNGFQNTALLWEASDICGFEQFCPEYTTEQFPQNSSHKKLRLGKWVEKFVAFQLQQQNTIDILAENIVVKNDKQTIGELDMLLLKENQPIHLEIIYKFYLYDIAKNYENNLDYWIGPNRNDALTFKLKKLKEKQFPLLYQSRTIETLKDYQIDANAFKQQVCFKAQLFLPFDNRDVKLAPLNSECVIGWYLNFSRFDELKDFQFYIPDKLEWLSLPRISVDWLTFNEAKRELQNYITHQRSQLLWIKNDNKKLQKCFITWW